MALYKRYIIYLGVVFLLLSCTHSTSNDSLPTLLPELTQAENVMYAHPDSALNILERMTPPAVSDKYQYATWCLLISQAKVKNYIRLNSDSILSIAYNYFQQQDNPQRKALAGYLKGIYMEEEKHDGETALEYYMEAAKEVEKTEDYQLAHLIYGAIGNIYAYRSLTDYAINAYQKAYDYAQLSNNKTYISTALSYLGRVYSIKHDANKSISYYKKALKTAEENNDNFSKTIALNELAAVYTAYSKDYRQALIYALESLNINKVQSQELSQNYLTVGNIYRQLKMNDSAQYYLDKATTSENIYTVCGAYQALYYLNRAIPQNHSKAMLYCDKFYTCIDSVTQIEHSKEIIAMKEKYEHEKLLNEKNTLQIEKERITRNGLYTFLFIISIAATLIVFYQRKLIRKERTIQLQAEQLRIFSVQIHNNETQIEQNNTHISQLTEQIVSHGELQETVQEQQNMVEELKQKNVMLQKQTDRLQKDFSEHSLNTQGKQKAQMASLNKIMDENTMLRKREEFLCKQLILHTDVLASLIKSPKPLDIYQWEEVQMAINRLYDNFTERLKKQIPSLTENDLQVCCLIKLHISVANMATILGISPTSVSKRKQRLKEQIMKEVGELFDKTQLIDIWLWEY